MDKIKTYLPLAFIILAFVAIAFIVRFNIRAERAEVQIVDAKEKIDSLQKEIDKAVFVQTQQLALIQALRDSVGQYDVKLKQVKTNDTKIEASYSNRIAIINDADTEQIARTIYQHIQANNNPKK